MSGDAVARVVDVDVVADVIVELVDVGTAVGALERDVFGDQCHHRRIEEPMYCSDEAVGVLGMDEVVGVEGDEPGLGPSSSGDL